MKQFQYLTILFLISIVGLIFTPGCGYSARNSETVGQVKSIVNVTPLFCPNYTRVHMSLGVVQNGTGSMSTQDVDFVVDTINELNSLTLAQQHGNLVKVWHDNQRVAFCKNTTYFITKVELLK